jgi:hypothetical protein
MSDMTHYINIPRAAKLVLGVFFAGLISFGTYSLCLAALKGFNNASTHQKKDASVCLSAQEAELIMLVNRYREQRGLPSIEVSRSLTTVARLHASDLQHHTPNQGTDSRGMECNMHSWSSHGSWTAGCYTSDHRFADLMRSKPREITANAYDGAGYEVVYWTSGQPTTPALAFESWSRSPDHRALLFETGKWSGIHFKAIGAAFSENYVVLWFGQRTDPQGSVPPCENSPR